MHSLACVVRSWVLLCEDFWLMRCFNVGVTMLRLVGRAPKLWIDNFSMDQTNIAANLRCLDDTRVGIHGDGRKSCLDGCQYFRVHFPNVQTLVSDFRPLTWNRQSRSPIRSDLQAVTYYLACRPGSSMRVIPRHILWYRCRRPPAISCALVTPSSSSFCVVCLQAHVSPRLFAKFSSSSKFSCIHTMSILI